MKTAPLMAAAAAAAALMALGGALLAEAHNGGISYYNITVNIQEYYVVEYDSFDLVRMKVWIENLDVQLDTPHFCLGSNSSWSCHATYADVRGRGGDVSVDDCVSKNKFDTINTGDTGETDICFMIGKQFEPDALSVYEGINDSHINTSNGSCGSTRANHLSHTCGSKQVIPFHDESVTCFVNEPDFCNQNNIQPIDGSFTPQPGPEREPPTLLYTLYNNGTGTLTLVFSDLVVASDPDRIGLIHDIDAFIKDGEAPGLGEAELNTVDNKQQSAILAFTLPDMMRLDVAELLRTHGDLALYIDTRAIYAAEGFVDITSPDNSPILEPNIIVVR
ncbi:MAG: hypothetical protein J4G04_06050 [Nitrosopumilaceae archaeon]|nr:hypothetical protein [Nitrosopumilaceae archaeon]